MKEELFVIFSLQTELPLDKTVFNCISFRLNRFFLKSIQEKEVQNYKKCFSLMKEWKVEQLSIRDKAFSQIVKNISEVKFPNLTSIDFFSLDSVSIQRLCRIYLPSIKDLRLGQNKISTVKCLRKGNWQQLSEIFLRGNLITQFGKLTQLRTSKIKILSCDYEEKDPEQCCDMRWVVKMRTQKFQQIRMKSKERIKQHRLIHIIAVNFEKK